MPRYFFDMRDNEAFTRDDVGLEYSDIQTVKAEATRALAEMARDIVPATDRRELAIEVHDQSNRPVLRAMLTFEVQVLTDG